MRRSFSLGNPALERHDHAVESGSAMLSSGRRSASSPNLSSAPAASSINTAATA
jgi:hypothetical protein